MDPAQTVTALQVTMEGEAVDGGKGRRRRTSGPDISPLHLESKQVRMLTPALCDDVARRLSVYCESRQSRGDEVCAR